MSVQTPLMSVAQQMRADGLLPDTGQPPVDQGAAPPAPQSQSIAQQMLSDGSLPDKPESPSAVPMRAVVAAASTMNPDAEAKTQQLAQQAGMGPDLTRANPEAARQRALALDLERRQIEFTNPILARQLSDPNFAAVAHDDLDSLSRIEQGAAVMRAPTARERFQWNYEYPVARALTKFPPTRVATDALAGTAEFAGDIGSFFGLHGNGPTRQNFLQRFAQSGAPEAVGLPSNGGDAVVRNVAPMVPAMVLSGGASVAARAMGLSENAAKVLAAVGVGGAFTADQGGRTFTHVAAAGKSDAEARHAADVVAGINAPLNVAMGVTDLLPGLRDFPLLSALGIGGAAGAVGQFSQNVVTGQPLPTDLAKSALEGAAVQGGMHLGFDFLGQMGETIDAVKASKLRTRSPEQFERAMEATFEGDPSVRIPAQEFVDYFATKNIDPAEMANHLGATNLEEAAAAGSDLEIPRGNFFGRLDPDDQKQLLPDVVNPATEMTARQAEAGHAELEEWVNGGGAERLAAEFAQADAETQASPGWQRAYSELKERYVGAGETEPVAESFATKDANAFSYFARHTGQTLDEVMALHAPKIVAGEAPGTTPLFQGGADEGVTKTETPEFKKWFGESKVVDDEGKPLVAYHGTRSDFEAFDLDSSGTVAGSKRQRALFFSTEPETANAYARIAGAVGEGGRAEGAGMKVMPVYLRVENPYVSELEHYNTEDFEREIAKAKRGGHDGIVFPRVTYGHETGQIAVFDPKQVKSAIGNRGTFDLGDANILHQDAGGDNPLTTPETGKAPEGTRGWMRLVSNGPDRFPSVEIGKTKIGDFSTFIHEPAHAYLELFRTMSRREDASDQLKSDFATIAKALGTTPEEVHKDGFTRAQHELWARMNELYVREGKAPNSAMQRVFNHFSVWLHRIYRQASALGVEMAEDIHGVMDRLYAGEQAVDRAAQEAGEQRLIENPEDVGWTEAEYRNYAEANDLAVDEARAQVVGELNEAAARERTQSWRDEARDVRDAATEQIDAMPEYAAIRSLRRGKLDDGVELTLNREALVKQFGEDRVKALQKLHRGIYRLEGGTDAETAAEILGFHSGDEMMRALEAAPRRGQAIEAATRETMTARHGDIRFDGTLDDKAIRALDEKRANVLYRELTALRKKLADSKAAMAAITIEPLEHYQEAARQMVEQKAPADLSPYRYLNASRKYSREAFEALRKGNVRKAAEAKNKELLNHFLFREAAEARDWVGKFEKYAQRVQSKGIQQRLGLAGSDYREQFNWLLARYRMGPAAAAPERSLREWAEEMYGTGNEPAIAPSVLNESRFADYRSVPTHELRELRDALVNIRHLAQREFTMFVQGKQVAFAEARAAMVQSARENLKVKPERIFEENRKAAERAVGGLQYADALLVRMERLIEWLDGGKAGPWHDNLWNLAADAQGDEYALQETVTKAVTDALADMPHEMRRRLWTEKVNVDGISEPLTRRRMLSMAFNMGNDGNLDRLRKTFLHNGWDPEAIRRVGGMLTHEEWQFVQRAWDSLKPLGERMNELEKRLTGLPPVMVKVTPFKVALDDGREMDLAGGYFPIVMDPRFSERAITQEAKETAQNAMQSGYVRATTSRGYTKERTGFGGPLLLDYERVLTSHVAKVAKDLSHREFMLSSQRLLLDTEVRKSLRETLGPAYERQFMPWLRTIINDRNGSVDQGLETVSNAMQKLRANFVAAAIGFNPTTLLLQISHAPRMMLYARPGSLAQALGDFLAHPFEMTHEIHDLSPNEMRFRGDNLDRDVRAVLQNPTYRNTYTRKIAVAARFSLATVDHLLSHTLWRAAYRDGLEKYADLPVGEAQKKAVYDADSAVRLGLNAQAAKDLPAIMRNNDFNKMITVLYGFHNGVYNQLRDNFHQARYDRNAVKLTYTTVLTALLPAVLGDLLTSHGPKDGENPGLWAAQRALLFSADTIPLLSSMARFMEGGSDVQFTPLENVMQKGARAAMEASSGKDDKDWLGISLDTAEAAGEAFGVLGSHPLIRTLRYLHRADVGKIENPNVWNAIVGGGR